MSGTRCRSHGAKEFREFAAIATETLRDGKAYDAALGRFAWFLSQRGVAWRPLQDKNSRLVWWI